MDAGESANGLDSSQGEGALDEPSGNDVTDFLTATEARAADGPTWASPNLVVNGGAESGSGSSNGQEVVSSIPDWETAGHANVLNYGAGGGYPQLTDPGPDDRGLHFFAGGPSDSTSTFTQRISLSMFADAIGRGATYTLSGYLGGYSTQDDSAVVTVFFLGRADGDDDASTDAANDGSEDATDALTGPDVLSGGEGGAEDEMGPFPSTAVDASSAFGAPLLAQGSIGPVLAAQREGKTGLFSASTTGGVPPAAAYAVVQLVMLRAEGTENDGYADNLSLTLNGE